MRMRALPMSHQASSVPLQPLNFDPARVATPAFVVDLSLLRRNLELLARVQREAGCKVLLALKGFAMFSTFPLVRQYLSGCCASGLHEALLAREEFGKEVHVYSPGLQGRGDAADHSHRGSCVIQLRAAVAEVPAGARRPRRMRPVPGCV